MVRSPRYEVLREAFIRGCPQATGAPADELDRELAAFAVRANAGAGQGEIAIADEELVTFAASKIDPGATDPIGALRALRADHLAVALACGRGDRRALAWLDRSYFARLGATLAHFRKDDSFTDEVRQRLRERLLTATAERAPRILEYGGRGDLGRWIRSAALRIAVDVLQGTSVQRSSSGDDALADLASPMDDPELDHLKTRYGAEVRAALRDALASLEPQTRTELRLYYLDGLTLEEIAGLFHVSTATMSRRLAGAREAIFDGTRAQLRQRLGATENEVASILRLAITRLELSRGALESKR